MAKTGLIVGKFLPFHKGHLEFINRSLEICDKLYILIDRKDIVGYDSIKSLTLDIDDRVEFKFIEEYNPQTTQNLNQSSIDSFYYDYWIPTIKKYTNNEDIDYLCCTDQSYVDEFYKYLKKEYSNLRLFYYSRDKYCASRIRLEPWKYRNDIVGFKPKNHVFVFEGGESTGKTTLAQKIARDLNGHYVEEYGREYSLIKSPKLWTGDDWTHVGETQNRRIEKAAQKYDLVIADTSSATTQTYKKMYGNLESSMFRYLNNCTQFVFKPDVEFVQDGTRDHTLDREKHFNLFYTGWQVISGNYKQRELAVLHHMNKEFFK